MSAKKSILAGIIASALVPAFAAATTYKIDSDHTYPSLEMPHMGVSIWRGKFDKTTGSVVFDPAAKTGTVEIRVETGSIDFGLDSMHKTAVTADWLNVAKYPTMTYTGTLHFDGDRPTTVDGQLTLRGVTRPLTLKINSFKCMDHPFYKREVCGADAEGDLNRADFGMTLYSEGGAGKMHLRIQVEALKAD